MSIKKLEDFIFKNKGYGGLSIDELVEKFNITPHDKKRAKNDIAYAINSRRNQVTELLRKFKRHQKKKEKPKNTHAKILVFDIETAPIMAYVWRLWDQNVSTKQIISDWFMLTWSAKWLFDDHIMSERLKRKEAIKQDDKRITEIIWELLDKADIVIAHNAKKFDIKRLNTRFLAHGLKPPMPYKVIDTLTHARKQFNVSSNRLDYLGEFLGVGRKLDTGGFELWERCMRGEKTALKEMEVYNIQDVKLLEDVYIAMRPYIKPHPNLGLFIEDNVSSCPNCGSQSIIWGGSYATNVNIYEAFRCSDCGSIGRSRKGYLPTHARTNLTVSV